MKSLELCMTLTAAAVSSVLLALPNDQMVDFEIINAAISLSIMVTLSVKAFNLVRCDVNNLFSAAVWFRISTIVYFGFGNLVPIIIGPEGESRIRGTYDFTESELLKSNLLILVSVSTIIFAISISAGWYRSILSRTTFLRNDRNKFSTQTLAKGSVVIGGIFRYSVKLPHILGTTDSLLPAIFDSLGLLFYTGLFLLTVNCFRLAGKGALAVSVIVLFEIAVSISTFSKTELFLLIVILILAAIWSRVNLKLAVVGLILGMLTYLVITPIVNSGREYMLYRYQSLGGAGLSERLELITNFASGSALLSVSEIPTFDYAILRLSYSNVSTFLINQYDTLKPGNTFENVLIVLIPRIFWPGKPIISAQGIDLTELINGSRTSSTGAGIFADSYWNYGWAGVVITMFIYGIILSGISQLSLLIMRRERWFLFPFVLAGIKFGMRVDGTVSGDIVGPFGIMITLLACLVLIERVFKKRTRTQGVSVITERS